MYTLIAIFYTSLIAITGMIFLKRRESRTGKPSLISRLGRGSDHVFAATFASGRKFLSYLNRHTFVALAHWIVFHILKGARNVYVEIKHRVISTPQGKKMLDAVRGRGEVKKEGASFYLRRIGADEK
jgi:preprotein translocase subunit SecG